MQASCIKVKKAASIHKNKTKDEKFDVRCQLKSIDIYLGLRKKWQSQVSKQCQLLQSYYVLVSRLLGSYFVCDEMTVNRLNTDFISGNTCLFTIFT